MKLKDEDLKIVRKFNVVQITHKPTGIAVTSDLSSSREANHIYALHDLTEAVAKYLATCATAIAQTQVKLYGCHDQPRPVANSVTHYAQDGYHYSDLTSSGRTERYAVVLPIHHTMSTECMYDLQTADKRCKDCKHIRK